jgi:hypothetical protein
MNQLDIGDGVMNKEQLFRLLYKNQIERNEYCDTIPHEFREAVLFNKYVESLVYDYDVLIDVVFGEHSYSVKWFLYEWQPGYKVGLSGEEETPIHNIDEMIDWMKKNEGFE